MKLRLRQKATKSENLLILLFLDHACDNGFAVLDAVGMHIHSPGYAGYRYIVLERVIHNFNNDIIFSVTKLSINIWTLVSMYVE